jgi:hypothetical protein
MASITSPQPFTGSNEAIVTGGNINVTMDDAGSTDDFDVRIYVFPRPGGGTQMPVGSANFPGHSTGTTRTVSVAVGSIDPTIAGNNRVVEIEDLMTGDVIGNAFRARPPGSTVFPKQFQAKFCRRGQLVPVALILKLDSKVTKGTCAKCTELNRPTMLLHSPDAEPADSWFSRPIAFCGKGKPPGYWVLRKNSATAWTLVLKQDNKVIVTFTAKTKRKDCTLPIKLQRKGAGSKVCKDWPQSVGISPAE